MFLEMEFGSWPQSINMTYHCEIRVLPKNIFSILSQFSFNQSCPRFYTQEHAPKLTHIKTNMLFLWLPTLRGNSSRLSLSTNRHFTIWIYSEFNFLLFLSIKLKQRKTLWFRSITMANWGRITLHQPLKPFSISIKLKFHHPSLTIWLIL